MARRKRKMVDVLDPERFAQAKAAIVRFGEQEGQTEKITDAKALRAMVSTAATMYNCPGERLMLWTGPPRRNTWYGQANGWPMRLSRLTVEGCLTFWVCRSPSSARASGIRSSATAIRA